MANIITVVKRNREEVPFDASKMNKWAEYASKQDVSWSDMVMTTVDQLYNKCTTKEIHQAMINACVNKKDEKHLKVAARLLRGNIYKDVYGKSEPDDFSVTYKKLVEKGYWQDFHLNQEELKRLDETFDPMFDKNYEFSSLLQFLDKYALSDLSTGVKVPVETPQVALMGISLALFKDDSFDHVINFYNIIKQRKINIATPIMAAARTGFNEFTSCFLATAGDSLKSISAGCELAYTMTANRSGVGFEFDVRSDGDIVGNNKCFHSGKLPQYKKLLSSIKSVTQGSRAGAATVTYNVLDPEIDDLLRLKNPVTAVSKRIELMDYSLAWNNDFLRRVAKNEKWLLISKRDAPDLHDAMYNNRSEFPELMEKYLEKYSTNTSAISFLSEDFNPKKVEKFNGKVVDAREVMKTFLTQRQETGRMYCINIDTSNDHTPYDKDVIRMSNLCVAPETKILTEYGNVPISELEGEVVKIWNGSEWSETKVEKTGENQKLVKVSTSSGQELECTEYHKFYVFDGYGKKPKMKRAYELQKEDKLVKFELPVVEGDLELEDAYINGFYSGDGSYFNNRQNIYLYHEKRALESFILNEKCVYNASQDKYNRDIISYNHLKDKFFVPSEDYSVSSRLSWLSGFLDADGCIYRNGSNEAITATSIEFEFLKEIQMMLQTLGVSSKIAKHVEEGYKKLPKNDGSNEMGDFFCKDAYRLLITSCDSYKLLSLGLEFNRLSIKKRLPQRDAKHFNKVVSVVDEGRIDDTYCFTEDKRGMGMFNGILTGQCQETLLPTRGFNHLLSLYKPVSEDDGLVGLCFLLASDVGKCEEDEVEEVNYYACRALDNIISITSYPFESLEDIGHNYRSIGVGITNLAYLMAKKGFKYSTEEGRNFIHEVSERHQYYLYKASCRLAEERGKFGWYDRTKYAKGLLCIDTYTKEIDKHHSSELKCDWGSLRNDISKYGLRFSTHSAHMPCESSSGWTYSTNSVYPIREGMIMKSRPEGMYPFTAPEWEKYQHNYEIAWDIDTIDMYKNYGIIQKFTCQGISADSWKDFTKAGSKVSLMQLMKEMLFSQKVGMKTHYYSNAKTKKSEDKVEEKQIDCDSCSL